MTRSDIINHLKIARVKQYEEHIQWYQLSKNNNISFGIVKEYIHKPWVYKSLCWNRGITMTDIVDNMHLPWRSATSFFAIGYNPNLTFAFAEAHTNLPWDFSGMSNNPSITIDDLENRKDIPWYVDSIISNPVISMDYKLDKYGASYIAMRSDLIADHPITIQQLRKIAASNRGAACWYVLSMNKHITIHDIVNNLDLPWDKHGVSNNPNMSPQVMQEYGHLFEFDTSYVHLTMCDEEYIEENIESFVNENGVFTHGTAMSLVHSERISIGFVERNATRFPEEFHVADMLYTVRLGDDVNRLVECVENIVNSRTIIHEDRREGRENFKLSLWDSLSANKNFLEITEDDIVQYAKQIVMASRIKRQFKRSISDPSYRMCVCRLLREFSECI